MKNEMSGPGATPASTIIKGWSEPVHPTVTNPSDRSSRLSGPRERICCALSCACLLSTPPLAFIIALLAGSVHAAPLTSTGVISDAELKAKLIELGVQFTAAPPIDPPVPPTSLANCTNQHYTVIPATGVTAAWAKQGFWHSSASGNFNDSTVWLFVLTVPAGTAPSTINGRADVVEDNGPGTFRQMTISTVPCDFRPKDYTGVNGPLWVSNGVSVGLYFGVGFGSAFGNVAGLTAGKTYYISVRNWQLDPIAQPSCGLVTCNAVMSMQGASP